jgi:hypothetical protein
MEDSPTGTQDLWMSERNEEDTKFVRVTGDTIPTKGHPQVVSELSIVEERKHSSVTDKCFRDTV